MAGSFPRSKSTSGVIRTRPLAASAMMPRSPSGPEPRERRPDKSTKWRVNPGGVAVRTAESRGAGAAARLFGCPHSHPPRFADEHPAPARPGRRSATSHIGREETRSKSTSGVNRTRLLAASAMMSRSPSGPEPRERRPGKVNKTAGHSSGRSGCGDGRNRAAPARPLRSVRNMLPALRERPLIVHGRPAAPLVPNVGLSDRFRRCAPSGDCRIVGARERLRGTTSAAPGRDRRSAVDPPALG